MKRKWEMGNGKWGDTAYIQFRFPISDFPFPVPTMGKGDKRTKKGKIYRGTYGKRRPRKLKKKAPPKRA